MRLIVDVPKDIVDTLNSEEPLLSMKQEADLFKATYKALNEEICEDAISRRDMALNIVSFYNKATGKKKTLDFLCKCVEGLPPVQPKQNKGRWIPVGYDGYADGNPVYDWWECSECGWEHTGDEETLTPYCPNCGAKME